MQSEFSFNVTIRGNVTPDQWRRLQADDREVIRELEDLFRDRLNAHVVTIEHAQVKAA